MITIKVTYLGELQTRSVHQASGAQIVTDAPKDNNGRGEAFSKTDLTATSLANCVLTMTGIASRKALITPIDGTTAEVKKVNYVELRRIGEIHITLTFPKSSFTEKERKIYEHTAQTCLLKKVCIWILNK